MCEQKSPGGSRLHFGDKCFAYPGRIMIRVRSAVLACSLALASVSVLAAASSSATFSNIQFQLTDLTPGDAQQSGFSFTMPGAFSFSGSDWNMGGRAPGADWGSVNSSGSDSFVLQDGAGHFQWGNSAGGYRVDAASMSIWGHAHGFDTAYFEAMNADAGGSRYPGYIEIAPHTELRFSVDVHLTASATNPMSDWFGTFMDLASARANFYWSYFIPGQPSQVSGSDHLYATAIAVGDTRIIDRLEWVENEDGQGDYIYEWHIEPGYEQVVSRVGSFQSVISNTSDSPITAMLYLGLEVAGQGYTAPVPEPSGVLLTLSGLALMAVAARRRSRG